MRDMPLKYVSGSGAVTLDLRKRPYICSLSESDLYDYGWTGITSDSKNTSLARTKKETTLPIDVIVELKTEKEKRALRERLFEIFEKDVINETPGRLYVGDYFITVSFGERKLASYTDSVISEEYVATLHSPSWFREHTFEAGVLETSRPDYEFLGFPKGFPRDFSIPQGVRFIENPSLTSADFKMIIYGPVAEPYVWVGGQVYHVDCEIGVGEYLVIDSLNATIVLHRNLGQQVNMFSKRDKLPEGDTFAKIKPGKNNIVYNGAFRFDLTLYEERSTPKW